MPLAGPQHRRIPRPPSSLDGELVRTRLVDVLAARFDEPITVVVAGAGFGKTTALAQAMRANDCAPRGVDAWVACEPQDEDAGRLASAILSALGAAATSGNDIDGVLDVLRAGAPTQLCVLVDDLHRVPAGSAGVRFVGELASRLPWNAHLVLASREPLPIPLARRRAAGQVVELGGDVLAFTDAEVAALAGRLGRDVAAGESWGGWPSLVQLSFWGPSGATRQFLWEEVVARLSPPERAGLLALAVLGSGSADDVSRVAGGEVDADRLIGAVPLVHQDAEGRLGVHPLWVDAVEGMYPAEEVLEVRRRVLRLLGDKGETVCMGSSAARWGDPDAFRVACVGLVRENLGSLPIDTALGWLASTPPGAAGGPEHRLLALAVRCAVDPDTGHLDDELDAFEAGLVDSGAGETRAVALALGATVAHTRGDVRRLANITQRISAFPAVSDHPLLHFFLETFDAALAALGGDIEGSLRTLEAISPDRVPPAVRELATRVHVLVLVLAGRAEEAVPIGRPLLESPNAFVRSIPSLLRWAAGDPSEYLLASRSATRLPRVDHSYRFWRAAQGAVVAGSLGDRELADACRSEIERTGDPGDPRDSALACAAIVSYSILEHDATAATSAITAHLARHPLSDARGEAYLRHNLAMAYVGCPDVRPWWDAAVLGPMHRRARAVAGLLLAAREGGLDHSTELGSPTTVLTSLPLPWSVELAVRAIAAGCNDGRQLMQALTTSLPAPTHCEVEWLADHGDTTCRAAAAELLAELADPAREPLAIDVLGPLRLRAGDAAVAKPELRRGRVRTLLALLVLRGTLRRDRIGDLIWPELDPDTAARNLRVTLSHLRRVLERDRPGRPSMRMIRSHSDSIELTGAPLVDTDLERLHRHLAAAEVAERAGDANEVIGCLGRAVDLWRGEPLVDLSSIDELNGEIEHLQLTLVDACLRLGELQLVAGRTEQALRCAERSRLASPYSERAHRLTVACHLQRSDHSGLESAIGATRQMLEDLGVEPEEPTQMLLDRAAGRLSIPAL